MHVSALWPAALCALAAVSQAKPTRTRAVPLSKRAPAGPEYVSTENGHFTVNGSLLNFVGTNAYWLAALDKEEDIDKTLADIAAAGVRVVRTWGFNDVVDIPETGTWFQQIKDGQLTVNEGPNGLQKLDKVIELAQKHDIYVIVSLTNNWNPDPSDAPSTTLTKRNNTGSSQNRSRNELSNDYGGMDAYVRGFGLKDHAEFYKNSALVDAFKNYTTQVVQRNVNKPNVFGWELANDPRCNSTLPAGECTPQDVTRWHATIAEHIRTIDTNHLISAGHGGYFCVDCEKLFPLVTAPPPAASPVPGRRRSTARFLTKRQVLRNRVEVLKKRRTATPQRRNATIRGRWAPTSTRRQEDLQAVGPAFDGSFGVDSQDILNIPDMDFGSFQLFPDQNKYGVDDPTLSPFENTVQQGNDWIRQHGQDAANFGKPITLNAFGLVTQDNAASFAPFDGSSAPFGSDGTTQTPFGVTNDQRTEAYRSWIDTGLNSGLTNVIQYQWGQPGLSVAPGTPVSISTDSTGIVTSDGTTGVSPNDGYSINDSGRADVVNAIQEGNAAYGSDASLRR
ncbi:hypothetical protein NMY22_g8165 [Coprinellus aureogranulatus]|nr:hypothetical protein NMY22_g8165 [Coprinellus aureogranulatus]